MEEKDYLYVPAGQRRERPSGMERIGVGEAAVLLGESYPGVGGLLALMGEEGRERAQYVARLMKEGTGTVEFVARYGAVEFREPYREAYLETGSAGDVREELSRLAGEGYCVVHQEVQLGMTDGTVYPPG